MAHGQIHRALDGVIGIFNLVKFFEIALKAHQNFHRIFGCWLGDIHFQETAREGAVFLKMLAIFLVGGRTHTAKLPALQRWLKQVRGIHRAARRCARADNGVNFVNEQHRTFDLLHTGHDLLEALFEITAVAGSRQQCAHIERIYSRVL